MRRPQNGVESSLNEVRVPTSMKKIYSFCVQTLNSTLIKTCNNKILHNNYLLLLMYITTLFFI